jgi:hypothetical protein
MPPVPFADAHIDIGAHCRPQHVRHRAWNQANAIAVTDDDADALA